MMCQHFAAHWPGLAEVDQGLDQQQQGKSQCNQACRVAGANRQGQEAQIIHRSH